MKVHTMIIDELHRFTTDRNRNDIGSSTLVNLFAMGAKRGIQCVLSNQLVSLTDPGIFGNLGCRIVTHLPNPKCIWLIQQSMGLSQARARRITRLKQREVMVAYAGHQTPFLVRVNEFSFPPGLDEMQLERNAQDFLARLRWDQDDEQMSKPPDPQAVTGDALKVFMRIAEKAETIVDRCEALGVDRFRESRARKLLESKGFIAEDEITLGNKMKIHKVTDKGTRWAEEQKELRIKVKRYKSGAVHEYLLNQVEKRIGSLNTKFSFQRNSTVAREYGIQPDSVLNLTSGDRVVIEIVCTNAGREAGILNKERAIPGVDMVIAVAANKKVRNVLENALEDHLFQGRGDKAPARLVVLDAGTCLDAKFDWVSVFEQP